MRDHIAQAMTRDFVYCEPEAFSDHHLPVADMAQVGEKVWEMLALERKPKGSPNDDAFKTLDSEPSAGNRL